MHARSAGFARFLRLRLRLWLLQRAVERLKARAFDRTRYSRPKMMAIGVIGAVALLAYYPVWKYLFPQPYENLGLRVAGSALFVPLALLRWWPRRLRTWLPMYWYAVLTLTMPCFVGYMTLRNGTDAWWMTHLVTVMLLMMLFDLISFVIVFVLGSALALLMYVAAGHPPLDPAQFAHYVPLLVFALVGGAVCSVSQNIAEQAQIDALTAASNNIAHEMRTPLGSVRIAAQAIRKYLPELLRSQRLAQRAGLPVTELRETHLGALERSLDVMVNEVGHANTVIDMLLLAARPIGEMPLTRISARACAEQAVARYPYGSRAERDRVQLDAAADFELLGSEVLLVHVLFNLLRNALFQTGRAGKGDIRLHVESDAAGRRIRVVDTGPGIPPDVLPRIFNRFYSHADNSAGISGLGIGLAFCRAAVEHMGGQISCHSRWGEYTEFTLEFPSPDSERFS